MAGWVLMMTRWGGGILLLSVGMFLISCGGGAANTGPTGPWSGTRTSQYVLRGDEPFDFLGPDASDPLIQAQLKQALTGRTFGLDLYEVENSTGALQQLRLHEADVVSSIYAAVDAYQIPGHVSPGADDTLLDLTIAGPTYAWETLNLRGIFTTQKVNGLVVLLHPNRNLNIVGPAPVDVTWDITGLNGSRLVSVQCKQTTWMYCETKVTP